MSASNKNIDQNSTSTRFANFWAKGVSGPFMCWKFSNRSQEEAQKLADDRVLEIVEKFRKEGKPPKSYLYADQRLREPVISDLHNAVISRNSYGCLILNTADVMFVDIDFPEIETPGIFEKLIILIGLKKALKNDFETDIIKNVEQWTLQNIGWGWRVYRTFAGIRLLATNECFVPDSPSVQQIFKDLNADSRYSILCKIQKCFRARLTPKPWRCNLPVPGARWPWASDKEANAFDIWEAVYVKRSAEFATCRLIKLIGNTQVHSSILPIVELHDKLCRVDTVLPLA